MQPFVSSDNYDAVIILSHHMSKDGVPNDVTIARIEKAIEIYRKYNIKYMVTSGWDYRDDCNISLAESVCKYINITYSISSSKILMETHSRDTVGDAYFTKVNLAIPLEWNHIIIITSKFHLKRAKEIFKFIYGDHISLTFFACADREENSLGEFESESLVAFKKTFKGIKAGDDCRILNAIINLHPLYKNTLI